MQFILKDGFIYIVNNTGIVNHNIEGDIIIKYVEDFENRKFEFSVNGNGFKPVVNERIIILKEELKKPYVDLVIRGIGKDDVKTYKVDKVPLTYAVIFGENIQNAYPEKIRALDEKTDRVVEEVEEKLSQMKATVRKVLDYIEQVEKQGRIF